jgi:hypothetical protein
VLAFAQKEKARAAWPTAPPVLQWNARSHADRPGHRCPYAPAMQHFSAADGPVSSTVSQDPLRLRAQERQCRRRRPDCRSWCEPALWPSAGQSGASGYLQHAEPTRLDHPRLPLRNGKLNCRTSLDPSAASAFSARHPTAEFGALACAIAWIHASDQPSASEPNFCLRQADVAGASVEPRRLRDEGDRARPLRFGHCTTSRDECFAHRRALARYGRLQIARFAVALVRRATRLA